MDAAQTNFKKIVFFLATALLLIAPFQASAQTLAVSNTAIVIGSSACNNSQTVTVASASTVQFTVAINYGSGNLYGNWLYANFGTNATDFGSTSTSSPITAQTGPSGVQLTIGLNFGLGTATPVAGVVLTPAGGSPQTITVNYTQNTSCGGNTGSVTNGFFSVTPGNIAISNSQPSQTVTIQDNIGTGFTFTPTASPANSWLSVNASSTTVSGNGSTAITVSGNANQTNGVGIYNGILTITPNASGVGPALNIPVVFTVSNSGGGGNTTGGTLTVNNTTSNTAIVSIAFVEPNFPGSQNVNLVDTASNATSYSWSTSTNSGGNWLLANNAFSGATPQNLAAVYGAYIPISLNPAVAGNLPSGAYSGAVVVTSISGSSATIDVNLYISAGVANGVTVTAQGQSASGAIYAFPNEAANTSFVQEEIFTVSAASGYSLGSPNLAVQGGNFTLESLTVNGNTLTFTVTSSSSGLIAGLYTATITVPSSYSNTSANTVITVVQPVGQSGSTATGGNTTTTTVQPTALTFQEQYATSFWTGGQEKQAVTITGAQGGQWSATVVYGAGASSWLTFDSANSGTFGNGPATLLVDLFNASSLNPSTTPYQAEIDITSPSGLDQIAVSLLVTPSNTPVLLGIPASTTFSITSGANTSSQTATIVGSDNTASTTSPPIVAGAPTATWLSATANGNTLTLSINNTAETTGVYSATVPITASAYSNAIDYPVVLILNGGGGGQTGGTGPLTLSSTALSYTNVTASITQDLNITASTSTTFTLTSSQTNCNTASWLTVTSGTYVANGTATSIPVTVKPAGIANGTTCNGVITLVSTSGNTGTQTVSVSMTVASSSGSGNVTVTPTTMTFAYTQGQSVPAAQTATVANVTAGTASITFNVSTTENNGNSVTWLSANVTSASTPYNNLSISVAPGNLPAATYTGTVTITPNGGNAQTIGVTMTVNANVTVTATPTTVNLTYTAGGTAPTATIQVSGGGATAAFTATASSTGGWLQVTPTSGTTPNTGTSNLTVSTVASALSSLLPSATPYTGTITIQGTSPATGTTIVNVSLTVSAPLPVISGVTNAASGATGSVSPGELISIFAPSNGQSPIGPASSVSLSSTTCPTPCTSVSTSMGGVTVTFHPGGFVAPLLYVSSSQINAVVPYQMAGISSFSVEVTFLGQTSNAFPLTLASTAPGIFTYAGAEQAAAIQYDPKGNFSYNASSTPATAGWTIVLYVTGEGVVVPSANTGAVTVAASTPPYTAVPAAGAPTVLFNNNTPATVSFYGEAPGLVSGVMQLNVVVPPGAGTGAVPITVTIGSNSSQAGVTVALQ